MGGGCLSVRVCASAAAQCVSPPVFTGHYKTSKCAAGLWPTSHPQSLWASGQGGFSGKINSADMSADSVLNTALVLLFQVMKSCGQSLKKHSIVIFPCKSWRWFMLLEVC